MRSRHTLVLIPALLGMSGCPTRDKYGQMPTVSITLPSVDTTYTNGPVTIAAALERDLELPIVLRLDGTIVLRTLESPVYSFEWDTTAVSEGRHTVVAEVALSNGTARSNPVTIIVDRQPPTVSLLSPSSDATDVMLRSPIQVVFSEEVVLPQSANAAISLAAVGNTIATTARLDQAGRVATITIDDLTSVPLPTTITGTVASTITDLAGNVLGQPTNWSWTVPDFIRIPNLTNPAYPEVAVGSDLRPVAAWSLIVPNGSAGDYQLQVSKYDGTKWNELGPPSSNLNSGARRCSIALDGQDRPFVSWTESSASGNDEIHVASWTGSGWDTSRPTISASFPSPSILGAPTLRIDGTGRPVVLRQELATAGLYELLLVHWDGTAWIPWFDGIEVGGNATMDLVLAENPIVSWIWPANQGHVSIGAGANWNAAPNPFAMDEPFVALDAAHNPLVVTGGSGSFVVQRLVNNEWQVFPAIVVPPQADYPRIAAGPDGLPIVAWFDAQTKSVGMARWTGQRWDTRAFAFGPHALDASPQLLIDRQGSAWIGWRDYSNLQAFTLWMSNY